MKHLFAGLALVALAGSLEAQVVGSNHDMTSTGVTGRSRGTVASPLGSGGSIAQYGEVCVYCHTPHSATMVAPPLWNRAALSTTPAFTMYAKPAGSTSTYDATPSASSLACLSCHDGTVAIDNVSNMPNGTYTTGNGVVASAYQMGRDLSNDHPISMTYPTAVGGTNPFKDISASTNVKLFSTRVECGSCHDPHKTTYAPFLRSTNAGSALCTTCHNK